MERGQIDQRIGFIEYDHALLKDVALLYSAVINTLPTAADLSSVARLGLNSSELAKLAFTAFQQRFVPTFDKLNLADQVRTLVKHVTGSEQPETIHTIETLLAGGGTWGDALLSLARAKPQATESLLGGGMLDLQGNLKLTQNLVLRESGWSADSSNDFLYGGEGNDYLVGGTGNDLLDGGQGIDVAVFTGTIENFGVRLATRNGVSEAIIFNRTNGEQDIVRHIEGVKIGATLYIGNAHGPAVVAGEDYKLSDFVSILGTDQLRDMGLPEYWAL